MREALEPSPTPPTPQRVRGRCSVPAAALLCGFLLVSGQGQGAARVVLAAEWGASGTVTLLSPLPQVGAISASARYVAWTATEVCSGDSAPATCSPRVIYLYDLHSGRVSIAARTVFGATGAIYHYHVSDHWLVYLDTGVGNTPSVLNWRIVVLDLATGRATILARSSQGSSPAAAVPPDLALTGSTLVWTSGQQTGANRVESTVSATDLVTGHTSLLARTATPFSFAFPAADGRRAVWERDDFTSEQPSSAIMGSALPPARPDARVLSGNSFASQPAVQGTAVVWKTGPGFAPGQIMLSSWGASAPPRRLSGAQELAFSPTLGAGFVAWSTGSTGRITIYNLRTGRTTSPSAPHADWIYGFPTASGSWLAYSYMTGVPARQSGPPPRGYVALRYLGTEAKGWNLAAGG